MKKTTSAEIELLAPAGNMASALAAFDAGADAVYCGLKQFNARDRSENFSVAEMAKLIAYARRNRKKVHVTFNTLIKESELTAAAETLESLASLGPDAVIVQDIGVLAMIRDFFPELTIHASTQMGFHNSAGLRIASKLGAKRAILERQVTLEEINRMTRFGEDLPLELEVFIHGALCCCLSGSCLFSSWLGGWSGNRGKCKQPCRRQYFDPADQQKKRGAFLFSPDDLCAADLLEDFRKAGVCSFKIEGRLRRADYVSKVVSAYRLLMDSSPGQRTEALKRAKEILYGTYTRKLSLGFYTDVSTKNLIRREDFGGSGVFCGKITNTRPDGFSAELTKRLHIGDTIRVQSLSDSDDGTTFPVLKMSVRNRPVMKALSGETCFIGTDRKLLKGSLIYKTGESCSDYAARIQAMPDGKQQLDLRIALRQNGISVSVCGQEWFHPLALSPAEKNPLTEEQLQKEFSASASERFHAAIRHAEVDGHWFIPASELKKLRRTFWQWVESAITGELLEQRKEMRLSEIRMHHRSLRPASSAILFPDCTAVAEGGNNPNRNTATAREIREINSPEEEVLLPYFTPETELEELKKAIARRISAGNRIFRVTSLFQLDLLDPEKVTIRTSFPLPLTNTFALEECGRFGVRGVQAWVELSEEDLRHLLKHSVLPVEVYSYGRPVLFSTRTNVRAGELSDSRGNRFSVRKNGILTCILPDRPFRPPSLPETVSHFFDLRNAMPEETEVSSFNFTRGLS